MSHADLPGAEIYTFLLGYQYMFQIYAAMSEIVGYFLA